MAQKNRTLLYVGIGCGLIVLLATCGVGGCLLFIKSQTDAPANMSHSFFKDVRTGNYQNAFSRMSHSYQQTHTLEQFQQGLAAVPALTQQTEATLTSRNVNDPTATMAGTLSTPSGDVPVSVQLEKNGEHWYIVSVTAGGATLQ